jgi:hypothetical protein
MDNSIGEPYRLDPFEFDEANQIMVQRTAAEQTKKYGIVINGFKFEQVDSDICGSP